MFKWSKFMKASLAAAAVSDNALGNAANAEVRVAFGDIASVESLHLLAALERAREKGVELEITYLKSEDIAAQAVVSGQADIGIGGPYALMQKVKVPVRYSCSFRPSGSIRRRMPRSTRAWKDMDGQEIAVHSRGSGTGHWSSLSNSARA